MFTNEAQINNPSPIKLRVYGANPFEHIIFAMAETPAEEPRVEGKTIGEISLIEPSERTMRQRIAMFLNERENVLRNHENPNASISELLDTTNPNLRPKFVELYRQEITAVRDLDPDNSTIEDVERIANDYQQQRDALLEATRPQS